jgi:hypothetical protein
VSSFWRRFSRCAHRPLSTPDVLIFWPSKHLRLVKRKETLVADAYGKENKNFAEEKVGDSTGFAFISPTELKPAKASKGFFHFPS